MMGRSKNIVGIFIGVVLVAFLLIFNTGCEQFGSVPKGFRLELISQSKNYDQELSQFVNRRPTILDTMGEGHGFWTNPLKRLTNNFFFNRNQTEPLMALPEDRGLVGSDFLDSKNTIKFIWLGHSTILVSMDNKIILIDPVFSQSASPLEGFLNRYQPPALSLDQLPKIDYILISHDHYDHLDMKTIKKFKDKDVKFISPLGVASHLESWGVKASQIVERDWWGDVNIDGLSFICAPAQHFSGRMGPINKMKTLWASWIVRGKNNSFYFSGDSGYDTHYKKIGQKFGPFDLVFMDSGQYNIRWKAVHNMPNEVIQGFLDLKGRHLVPVHWSMFTLSLHNWYDPIVESSKRAKTLGLSIMTPRLGQVVRLDSKNYFEKWWEDLVGNDLSAN